MLVLYRQLSSVQSTWIKKSPYFHWLNLAPGGTRVPTGVVAGGVAEWFTTDTPLPLDWSGEPLKDIVSGSICFILKVGSVKLEF